MDLALTPAHGDQATTFVAVEVHRDDLHAGADDPATEREAGIVLEHLAERPELLVLTVGVDDDILDQVVDPVAHDQRYAPAWFPKGLSLIRSTSVVASCWGGIEEVPGCSHPLVAPSTVEEVNPETDVGRLLGETEWTTSSPRSRDSR